MTGEQDERLRRLRIEVIEALARFEAIATLQRRSQGLREDKLLELAIDYSMASVAYTDATVRLDEALIAAGKKSIIQELARSSVPVGEASEEAHEVLSPWLETEPIELDDQTHGTDKHD